MPRMLRRAAVLGATAHVASKRGQAKGAAAAAPPPEEPAAAAPETPAAPETAAPTTADSYDELMKLKGLLDAGVLTQAEFDAEKQKILSS